MRISMPWDAPLSLLDTLSTDDVFVNAQNLVVTWLVAHKQNPYSARLQAVADLCNLLKKEPQRISEIQQPHITAALQTGGLKIVISVLVSQLNVVVDAIPTLSIDQFVTSCTLQLGAQLWLAMLDGAELAKRGGSTTDVPLQLLREGMFGVFARCCGKPLDEQVRLMIEQLDVGAQQLTHLRRKLDAIRKTEQLGQHGYSSVSDMDALGLLSQLDSRRPS